MAAVVDAVTDVVNTVTDTVSSVGTQAVKAVSDAGQAIVDNVVTPVVKAVEKTVDAAIKDPIGTAARVTAIAMAPATGGASLAYLPVISAVDTLAHGGSLEDSLKSAAITYATQGVASEVSGYINTPDVPAPVVDMELGPTPTITPDVPVAPPAPLANPIVSNIAGSTASGATRALLTGKDPLAGATSGLTSGLVGAGTNLGAKEISDTNLENWSQEQAQKAYENAPSPTEQDVLKDPSVEMNFPLSTPTTETGPGYFNEETGAYVADPNGVLQAPLDNTSGTNLDSMQGYTVDPATNTVTDPSGAVTDLSYLSNTQSPLDTAAVLPPPAEVAPEEYDPTKTSTIKSGLDYVANAVLNPSKTGTATPTTPTAGASPTSLSQQVYKDPTLSSEAQYLGPKDTSTQNTITDPSKLQELQQLYASLDPRLKEELQARGIAPVEATAPTTPLDQTMYTTKLVADGGSISRFDTGGTASSAFDSAIFNPTITKASPNMLPAAPVVQMPSRLGVLKHLYSAIGSKQPHMAAGGLPSKYTEAAPKGHNPEFVTGLTGYYAQGKGTGQSDDIPAMLHDGDYVADADLVAALGDGSSKAGAEALEKFRRQIPHQQAAGGQPVPAKIADGEYVFPASFVTAIGKGDNKAGAKLLDAMREAIRAHKRSAPTSKIPPKAKSPLDYLKMVKG
jgi:hypothetical protein